METFIGVATVIILITVVFYYLQKSGGKLIAEREVKIKNAEAAKAKILGFHEVGFRDGEGRFQAYRFTLEVSSAYKAPYQTKSVWNVTPMAAPKVQEGCEVDVKIDAEDQNIIYPVVEGVDYSWMGSIIKERQK